MSYMVYAPILVLVIRGYERAVACTGPGSRCRGRARVIIFVLTARGVLARLDVYAKNAKEDPARAEKNKIRRTGEALAGEA